jgi:hypothetical protein
MYLADIMSSDNPRGDLGAYPTEYGMGGKHDRDSAAFGHYEFSRARKFVV